MLATARCWEIGVGALLCQPWKRLAPFLVAKRNEVYGLGVPWGRELLRWDRQVCHGLLVRLATVTAAYVVDSAFSLSAVARQR